MLKMMGAEGCIAIYRWCAVNFGQGQYIAAVWLILSLWGKGGGSGGRGGFCAVPQVYRYLYMSSLLRGSWLPSFLHQTGGTVRGGLVS